MLRSYYLKSNISNDAPAGGLIRQQICSIRRSFRHSLANFDIDATTPRLDRHYRRPVTSATADIHDLIGIIGIEHLRAIHF